ncbi:hypothetical protein [Gaoshiqia sediminis]|uniref:Phage antirepressor KilAC domain-containing protein n=1 Tax=Gaoshiqia sediminis TaxID=2986998 RepID=A0AA41Y6X8_9BACT|nr:hypothetical protein [Gaoshiqia sediminis]MCW0484544.1 phage antirepressor KilAC domain-containing protein [Gaoshiqia sediminis]
MNSTVKKISTTSLAKKLDLSSKELFEKLIELKLMYKKDEQWHLTRKGTEMGGELASHPQYGDYVVWPADFDPDNISAGDKKDLFNATALGKEFNLSSQRINLILAEIGWIEKALKGWSVTGLGRKAGGVEFEHSSGGTYVLWPPVIVNNRTLVSSVKTGHDHAAESIVEITQDTEASEDLKDAKNFREKFPATLRTKDGHLVRSRGEILIDNSLYDYGLAHAYERKLPIEEDVYCDFYIPSQNNGKAVYIEYWGMESDEKYQARKERKKKIYQANGLNLIELGNNHIESLDDYLPKMLLKFGIRVE